MTAAALNVLAPSTVPSGPACRLTTTEKAAAPRDRAGDTIERRFAGGPPQQGIVGAPLLGLDLPGATPARLRNAETMETWARPTLPLRVTRLQSFDGSSDRALVTGTVPRYLAAQLAASDDALPAGDPIIMSVTLALDAEGVSAESPTFHSAAGDGARREPAYAFAEARALTQALGSMLLSAEPGLLQASPAVAAAAAHLAAIAGFENGAEPAAGAGRLVHRAGWVQRPEAEAIARALGPVYDCRIDPQLPSMVDEPRERPVAEALLTAALAAKAIDPALLYAVAADEGLAREVESWHRGLDGIAIPSTIDGSAIFGLTVIADEAAQLVRRGYLPSSFASTFREHDLRVTFVAALGRTALTNALTFVAARLAYDRDLALAAARRTLGPRGVEVDARTGTFLTMLAADGGEIAVTRYLQSRTARPLLPDGRDLRENAGVARAFMRTASWEQMLRTGVFEVPR